MFIVVIGIASAHSEDGNPFDAWVDQLNHSSFHARQAASQSLVSAASDSGAKRSDVVKALHDGLAHKSLEVRLACQETLGRIECHELDRRIAILTNPRASVSEINLPGWSSFSKLAGTDMLARQWFATSLDIYPSVLKRIESSHGGLHDKHLADFAEHFDPYRMSAADTKRWTMLIWLDTHLSHPLRTRSTSRSSRISMALTNSAMGPSTDERGSEVLRRMIAQWVRSQAGQAVSREWLLIATRYRCERLAAELCDQVFRDQSSPPATIVTALLSASAQGRSDLELQASQYLHDQRTSHVWQTVAPQKAKIRTQIRDVAMVVLLHNRGFDPRDTGFEELTADPVFVFRDHSLGFQNEAQREAAIKKSLQALQPAHPSPARPTQ